MGIVYEAYDEKLDRRIALKVARFGLGRLLSPEVRNASSVSHPNVCKIFEIHSAHTPAGDVDFITMEFLEGETLAQRLARAPMRNEEARSIALQICAGLAEAHRCRVVHGDLKPNNILLAPTADGAARAVITDFGLAQGPRQDGSSGGTPGYMAPELLTGASISVASDIYAFGVVLQRLLSSSKELRALEAASTVTVAASGSTPARSGTAGSPARRSPPGGRWDAIVKRCLAMDPRERFADVPALQRALDPPRRRRVLVLSALGAVILTASVAYWRVNAPPETVHLAVSSTLDLRGALQALRGTRQRAFHITHSMVGATHQLRVVMDSTTTSHGLHVQLLATGSQQTLTRWEGDYAPDELPFASVAAASVVSAALHLMPDPTTLRMNRPEARRIYESALPLLRDDDRLDEALALMKHAAAAEPGSPLPWAGQAEAEWRRYYLTQDTTWFARCKESVRRAELRAQDTPEVHRIAGLLEANDGRFAPAIVRYERATELPSTNSDAWRRLGEAYRRDNQLDLAIAALRKAVEVEPAYYRTHQDLGSWYFSQGAYNDAIPELRKAVALAPTVTRVRAVLANALMNVGRFADAERELRLALEQRDDPSALLSLGQVLMYQSRERDAIPFLRRAAIRDSSEFLTWLYLGDCHLRLGDAAESRAAYEHSFTMVENAVASSPDRGYFRGFLGYLCARLGDARRADVEVEQALRSSPALGDVMWSAALTYDALGQHDRAIRALAAAPRDLLEDLSRWPGASGLTRQPDYQIRLSAARQRP